MKMRKHAVAENTIVAYTQAQFKTISPPKNIDLAKDSLGKFLAAAHLTEPENAFKTMISIARIGPEAETALSDKQLELVNANLGSFPSPRSSISMKK